jgi:hypothetical protein
MEIDTEASPPTPPPRKKTPLQSPAQAPAQSPAPAQAPAQSPAPVPRRRIQVLRIETEASVGQVSPSSIEIMQDPSSTENERPSDSPSGTEAKKVRCNFGCQIS